MNLVLLGKIRKEKMIIRNKSSLTNDTLFKMFFTKNKKWLARVISDVTDLNVTEESITFIDKELFGDNIKTKKSMLDLMVKLPSGEIVFLEMQNGYEVKMPERVEYYKSKVVVNQIDEKEEYEKLKYIYAIIFINYNTKEFPEYKASLSLYNKHSLKEYKTVVNLNYINLTKNQMREYFSEETNCLLRYMSSKSEEERKILMNENMTFEEIYDEVKRLTSHPDYWIYDLNRTMAKLDENSRMGRATRKAEKKGMKQGIRQGIEQGIEQGTLQAKIETAKILYNKNMSSEEIFEITGINISNYLNSNTKPRERKVS